MVVAWYCASLIVAAASEITLTSRQLVVVLDSALPRPISVKYSKTDLSPPTANSPPSPQPQWWLMVESEALVVSGHPFNQTEFPKGTTNDNGASKVI